MSTTEEAVVVPNSIEWLEYFYRQQAMDDMEVPFGAISDAISNETASFGEDVFPSSETMLKLSCTDEILFRDPNITGISNHSTVFSPENSTAASNDLSPKAKVAKPVRRRSRASRRTPTTLLNCSIKNFRTLVQQYTGCQTAAASALNRSTKGPITLCFGTANGQINHDYPASFATSFGGDYHTHQQPQYQENQQHVDQAHEAGKQSLYSLGEYTTELTYSPQSRWIDHQRAC